MLEHRGALLPIQVGRVGSREPRIQGVLDGELELRSSSRFLTPVQNQQLLEPVEQFASDLLDLGAFLGGVMLKVPPLGR